MSTKVKTNNFLSMALKQLYNLEAATKHGLELFSQKAQSDELKKACNQHRSETEKQLQRLEEVFGLLEIDPNEEEEHEGLIEKGMELAKKVTDMVSPKKKSVLENLINEGMEKAAAYVDANTVDIAITQLGRVIEHIEIATYESLCAYLENKKDMAKVRELLSKTLEEEKKADAKFAEVAKKLFAAS